MLECKNSSSPKKITIRKWVELIIGQPAAILPALILGVIANFITTLLAGFAEPGFVPINIIWPILGLLAVLGLGLLLWRYRKLRRYRKQFSLFLPLLILIIVSISLMGFAIYQSFVSVPQLLLLPDSLAGEKLYEANLGSDMRGNWEGNVVRQRPRADIPILKGKRVELTINRFIFFITTPDAQFVVEQAARIEGKSYPFWRIPKAKLFILTKDKEGLIRNFRITGPLQTISDTSWVVTVPIGKRDDTGREFDVTAMISICDFGKSNLVDEEVSDINPCGNTTFSNTIRVRRR
jgi:hypothetical protein